MSKMNQTIKTPKKKRHEQTFIPGTEPVRNPEIEQALDAWMSAKDDQKDAASTTKIRHQSLLLRLAEVGIDRYPYIDPSTGKKRMVVVARDPKAKTITAPKDSKQRRDRGELDELGEEVTVATAKVEKLKAKAKQKADKVEHRKVPRASVEAEIDPFAATRASMDPKVH